uniref:anaphase-promoting complex subunit 7 n=1 Tax=Ciona intestinalis TaxID=7719 RepID=UPI0002B8E796|nr:anaphase-promoting complex subunit 7 [Ciona intestinalis]|eukprot:XP_018672400.1 anaphase-promoting complex subunit 7 [Ciona intestinalis]
MKMASVCIVDQLRMLHSSELHASVALLSGLAISITKNLNAFGPSQQYDILVYSGDSFFAKKEYKRAEAAYRRALNVRKGVPKNTKSAQKETNLSHVYFRIYECCMEEKNEDGALEALLNIEEKRRCSKVNYAIGKLYQARQMRRNAINCYKEVLRECPLALDCAIELLRLGEHPNVVISIMNVNGSVDWLPAYIKAHASVVNKEHTKSVVAFDALQKRVSLAGNPTVQYDLAIACYMADDHDSAMMHLKSLHRQERFWLRGMDLYASLLYDEKKAEELGKFSTELFAVSDLQPESWIALGYHALLNEDYTKAVYLAARANQLDPFSVQAFLLKAAGLVGLGEVQTALSHSKEAISLAPHRLDCYAKLVSCYMSENRNNDALTVAKSAFEALGPSPGSYVLCALTMLPDSSVLDKAGKLVDRALTLDPNHKSAIETKCTILYRQEKYSEAIKCLKLATQRFGSSALHCLLGDCYCKLSKLTDAVDHYSIALSLNPCCVEAKDGLSRVSEADRSDVFDAETGNSFETEESDRMTTGIAWPQENPWF